MFKESQISEIENMIDAGFSNREIAEVMYNTTSVRIGATPWWMTGQGAPGQTAPAPAASHPAPVAHPTPAAAVPHSSPTPAAAHPSASPQYYTPASMGAGVTGAPTSWTVPQDISFESQVLKDMGVKAPTAQELSILQGWKPLEGTTAQFNPWATTQNAPGATQFNSVGVKNFPNMQEGAKATAQTLQNGYYPDIVKALQTGNLNLLNQGANEFKTWSGGGYGPSTIIQNAQKAEPQIQAMGIPAGGVNPSVWKNVTTAPSVSTGGGASTGGGGVSSGGGGGVTTNPSVSTGGGAVDTSGIPMNLPSYGQDSLTGNWSYTPTVTPSVATTGAPTTPTATGPTTPGGGAISEPGSALPTAVTPQQPATSITPTARVGSWSILIPRVRIGATPWWMGGGQAPAAPAAHPAPAAPAAHPAQAAPARVPAAAAAVTHATGLVGAPISKFNQEQNSAVAAALGERGVPYVWGGTNPKTGLDCSGLTQYAWGQAGIQIPRTTYAQIAGLPAGPMNPKQWHVGDLIYPEAGHVGMYIGDGKIIQAPHTGTDVQVVPVSGGWSTPYAVRRPDPQGTLVSDPAANAATTAVPSGSLSGGGGGGSNGYSATNTTINSSPTSTSPAYTSPTSTSPTTTSTGIAPTVPIVNPAGIISGPGQPLAPTPNWTLPQMSPMTNNIPQMPGVPSTPDQWIPGMGIAPTSSWKMESNWKFAGTKEDLEEKDEEFHWKLHEEPKKMNEIVEEGEPNSIYASVSNYGEMIKEAAVLISALVPDPANPAADPTVTADPTVENNTVEETTNPGGFMNTLKTIPQTVQKGVNAVKADPTVRAIGEGYVAGQNFMEKLAPKIDKGMSFMNQITSVPGAGTLPNFPSGKGQHAYQYMYNNIRRTMEDYVADPNGPKAAMLKEILLKDGFSEAKIQEFVRDAEAERAAQASGLPIVSSVQPSDYGKIIEALQMITQEDRAIRAKKYEFYKIEEEKEGPKKEKPKSIHHELKKKGGEETTPEKKSLVLLKEEYFDLMNEQRFDEASTLIQQVEDPKAARAIAEEFYSAIIDRSRDT